MLKRLFGFLVLGLLFCANSLLAANTVYYTQAHFRGGVSLPVLVVTNINDAAQDEPQTYYPKTKNVSFNYTIPNQYKDKLALYYIGSFILAPKDWVVEKADFGADGSSLILVHSKDNSQALKIESTGGCACCAIDSIAQWVPGWINNKANYQAALECGFSQRQFKYPIHFVLLKQNKQIKITAFSYTPSKALSANGLIFYNDGRNGQMPFFEKVVVVTPSSQNELAKIMLNFML